jgi:LytS/YehU family sensor histidine kinase
MRVLLDMSIAYEGIGNHQRAISFAERLLSVAKSNNANQYIRDGYKILYKVNENLGNIQSAYTFYRLYNNMKDSIALENFSQKLALYSAAIESEKKETQIELLNRQNTINQQKLQLRDQELKATAFFRNALIAGVVLLVVAGLVLYRNVALKQKNEMNRREIAEKGLMVQMLESDRIKTEWQQQTTKLEMQALRAQMNPHFIFNSLNSINRFILQNNKLDASEYLTKFSNLIRMTLQNSEQSLITLKNELDNVQFR